MGGLGGFQVEPVRIENGHHTARFYQPRRLLKDPAMVLTPLPCQQR